MLDHVDDWAWFDVAQNAMKKICWFVKYSMSPVTVLTFDFFATDVTSVDIVIIVDL